MKKSKEKPNEETKSDTGKGEFSFFDNLLERLPPLGKEALLEIVEERKKHLSTIQDKKKDDLTYTLELEKAKNSCLEEYAKILFTQYQRLSADYANFQKRIPKQIADNLAYEKEIIIKSLLPAMDNLEHTLQNTHLVENLDALVKGINIIYDQMLDILKSHGVEQIKSLGENFNPSMHEAMMQMAEPQKEDNIILQEFQKGYKLNGRVIRPAKVVVNKLTVDQIPKEEDKTNLQQQINNDEADDEFETTDSE